MDSKHSDDDYIINDTEYEEDEADIAFDKQEKSKKKGSVIRRIILIICIIVFCVSAVFINGTVNCGFKIFFIICSLDNRQT